MHQLLVVDPKWVEEANDSLKQRLHDKMSLAYDVIKKFKRQSEYKFLQQCHSNPWTPKPLGDILSGKATNSSTGNGKKYFEVQSRSLDMYYYWCTISEINFKRLLTDQRISKLNLVVII